MQIQSSKQVIEISPETLEQLVNKAAKKGAELAIKEMQKRGLPLNKSEAAEKLGISRPTLNNLISTGKIKLNSAGKIAPEDLERVRRAA